MLSASTPAAYRLMHDGALLFSQLERHGIKIDIDYLESAITDLDDRIRMRENKLKDTKIYHNWRKRFGRKTNLDSPKQIADIFNLPNAQESTLETVNNRFVKEYTRTKKLKKLRATNLLGIKREMVKHKDGYYIHPFFNLHTTVTYRSSSDGINFQNIPIRDPELAAIVRRCFIPRNKDRCIVEIDFSGIEVCIAACYNNDPRLIEYIKNPAKDMHRDMAAQCYMLKTEDVTKSIRQAAKGDFVFAEFYGSVFQQCAPALWESIDRHNFEVGSLGIPLKAWLEDKGITELGDCSFDQDEYPNGTFVGHIRDVEHDFWNNRFKVYGQWRRDWFDAYKRNGYFDTLTGFHIEGILKKNDVINYPVQGSAFHCLLQSMIWLGRWMQTQEMQSKLIGQIHDSAVGDIAINELDAYLEKALEITTKKLPSEWKWINVPLTVEVEISPPGRSWYEKRAIEVLGKGRYAVKDDDGKRFKFKSAKRLVKWMSQNV